MPPLLIAGLAAGALQTGQQMAQHDSQKELAARTQEYSPWTHLQAQAPQPVNAIGNLVGGGMTGLSLDQTLNKPDGLVEGDPTATVPSALGAANAGAQAGMGTDAYNTAINSAGAPLPSIQAAVTPAPTSLNPIQAATKAGQVLNAVPGQKGAMNDPNSIWGSLASLNSRLGGQAYAS